MAFAVFRCSLLMPLGGEGMGPSGPNRLPGEAPLPLAYTDKAQCHYLLWDCEDDPCF